MRRFCSSASIITDTAKAFWATDFKVRSSILGFFGAVEAECSSNSCCISDCL